MVVPVGTGVASAVLVTLRMGDWANAAREDNARTETATRASMTEYLPYDRTAGNREQSIKRISPINYVEIDGLPADVIYEGSARGEPEGVFQIHAKVPARVTRGVGVPVLVTIGTKQTQPGVTPAISSAN